MAGMTCSRFSRKNQMALDFENSTIPECSNRARAAVRQAWSRTMEGKASWIELLHWPL
jgi:hypothetical protein